MSQIIHAEFKYSWKSLVHLAVPSTNLSRVLYQEIVEMEIPQKWKCLSSLFTNFKQFKFLLHAVVVST